MGQSLDQQLSKLGTSDSPAREITAAMGQLQGDTSALRNDLTRTALSLGDKVNRAVGKQTWELSAASTLDVTSIGDDPLDGDVDIGYKITFEGEMSAAGALIQCRPNNIAVTAARVMAYWYRQGAALTGPTGAVDTPSVFTIAASQFGAANSVIMGEYTIQSKRRSVARRAGDGWYHNSVATDQVFHMTVDQAWLNNTDNITSLNFIFNAGGGTFTGTVTVTRIRAL